jgi:hypothetical protein
MARENLVVRSLHQLVRLLSRYLIDTATDKECYELLADLSHSLVSGAKGYLRL